MQNKLVSVIIPVYKVKELYLRKCIESILEQTYETLEIILVDDGSPDDSGMICDSYALKDSRVQVLHTENGGVSNARNVGLSVAAGEYITFVDSDDFLESYTIEHQVKTLEDNRADCVLISCNTIQVDGDDENISAMCKNEEIQTLVLGQNEAMDALLYMHQPYPGFEVTAVWGTLYRNEILKGVRFVKGMAIAEDFVFKFEVFKKMNRIVISNQRGYNYLVHANSAMRNGFNKNKLNAIYVLQDLIENSDKKSPYYEGVLSRCVNIGFVILCMIPIQQTFKEERKLVTDFIKKYRREVLLNKKSRNKVKLAILSSYVGFDFTQRLFNIIQR